MADLLDLLVCEFDDRYQIPPFAMIRDKDGVFYQRDNTGSWRNVYDSTLFRDDEISWPVSVLGGETLRSLKEAIKRRSGLVDGATGHDEGAVYSVDPITGGAKQVKKARFDLIPTEPLRLLAEHFGHGATHYDERNWEKGIEWGKFYAAMQRHANDWWGGEDLDEDGFHHLAAVAFYALTLLEYRRTHPDKDDRSISPSRWTLDDKEAG